MFGATGDDVKKPSREAREEYNVPLGSSSARSQDQLVENYLISGGNVGRYQDQILEM